MNHQKFKQYFWLRLVVFAAMLVGLLPASVTQANVPAPAQEGAQAAPAAPMALTNTITLRVYSARTEPYWNEDPSTPVEDIIAAGGGIHQGDPITGYDYIINLDNAGDPFDPSPACWPYSDPPTNTLRNPDYPEGCSYPGIRAVPSHSPIVTQGDETLLSETVSLTLPDGDYLISVMAPDFKLDGQWFTLPMEETVLGSGEAVVEVGLQPLPLPTATIRVWVFNDNNPTNWGPDVPAEDGLEGFYGHVGDWGGEVTTDVFGNPICTEYYTATNTLNGYLYDADGAPVPVPGTGGECLSDANGDLVIPNMGTNRFEVWVVPPDGSGWTQTTTLEGNKPFDTWVMEGYTGYSTEFVGPAGENFPMTIFGFVQETDLLNDTAENGSISGVIVQAEVAVPFSGGLPFQGSLWGGLAGSKITRVVDNAWVALADLQGGDQAVYIAKASPDGSFNISNVPDGDYFFSYWDEKNLLILDWVQVTVRNGETVDLGNLFLTGWFTRIYGHVFVDDNENGKLDAGEHGIQEFPISMRRRENSEMDRGAVAVLTEVDGAYEMENVYPINQWIIMEAYADTYYTTGITFQGFNEPEETTLLGGGVDIGVMPVIGQSTRVDWGVKPYAPGENGGIAGTVFYETTRNELDPYLQAVEPWSMGIPGLTMNLYAPVPCGANVGAECSADGKYELEADGSLKKGAWLNTTVTEQWQRPINCQSYDVEGNPVDFPVLPQAGDGHECLEAILAGTLVQSNDFATVDGNWGFGEIISPSVDASITETLPMPLGDYLVEVEIPNDPYTGQPVYQVIREEDVNVFDGVSFIPQIPPPVCAGAKHLVDVAGVGTDGPNAVENPNFAAEGGSPYEGLERPLCDVKLVTVSDQRSVAPAFNLFTPTPIPGRHWGLMLDDLTLSTNPFEMTYGEKAGIPNAPIGIYDYTNRLRKVTWSDPHGYFQALLPSTGAINVPSPTGIAANMYYYVGNDPGQPGALNAHYSPQYRTIAVPFEVFPGIGIVADLAPTQIGVSIQAPGSQFAHPAACQLSDVTPQVFSVDRPYFLRSGTNAQREFTIKGVNFGAVRGAGQVLVGQTYTTILSWSDTEIRVRASSATPVGQQLLRIRTDNGTLPVNTLSIHVLGGSYTPAVYEVGPGRAFDTDTGATIQEAIEFAYDNSVRSLIVVYPDTPELWNPLGVYYENLVMHGPIKLQGIGPGGSYPDGSFELGTVLDGSAYAGDINDAYAEEWRVLVEGLTRVGYQTVHEGAVITVYAETPNQYTSSFYAAIDGFAIQGGNQQGFPNNINQIGGGQIPGVDPNVTIQGGGIFVNGYARYLQITNNILRSNGGAYGGAIRLGTPNVPAGPEKDSNNDNIFIRYNQIIANGGTNLAGAIGIFDGAERYSVGYNDICGNFSAEYGGAVSHYGYSPNGAIHNNRIYFNRSYDEGGGIIIAGELPADPATQLSPGAGNVDVYGNIIQGNLANDDGGGLRFLMAGPYLYKVYNNFIVNNVSTHEGGGISINDAPGVLVYYNTIMKNLTTATALTSTGAPAPAGLSTSLNSDLLQAILPASFPPFSNPLLVNNIFWDNRAGTWDGNGVFGLGLEGDPTPIYNWDMGVTGGGYSLSPVYSIISSTMGTAFSPTNLIGVDPLVRQSYDTSVIVLPWRGNPNFVGVNLVAVDAPPTLMGDYHLSANSPAINQAVASYSYMQPIVRDIDNDMRPSDGGYEIGADERGPLSGFNLVLPGSGLEYFIFEQFMPVIGH